MGTVTTVFVMSILVAAFVLWGFAIASLVRIDLDYRRKTKESRAVGGKDRGSEE